MKHASFKTRIITTEGEGGPFFYLPDIRFADPNPLPSRISPTSRKERPRGLFVLALLACLLFGACAHTAKHFDAPDSTQLRGSSSKLAQKVTEAKATAARASAAVSAAKVSADRESQQLAIIAPQVDDLLRVSPVELRPEIEALKSSVTELQAAHEETVGHVDSAKSEQSTLASQLEEANAAKNEVAQYGPAYFTKVDGIVSAANAYEIARAKDSKALLWYRLHWWGAWIVAGLGIVACLALAFLKATGRLAFAAAKA